MKTFASFLTVFARSFYSFCQLKNLCLKTNKLANYICLNSKKRNFVHEMDNLRKEIAMEIDRQLDFLSNFLTKIAGEDTLPIYIILIGS